MRVVALLAVCLSLLGGCGEEPVASKSEAETTIEQTCIDDSQKPALCSCIASEMTQRFSPEMLTKILTVMAQGTRNVDEDEWFNSLPSDMQDEYLRVGGQLETICQKYD